MKIERAYIFSSYSKGLATKLSDIDVAIISQNLRSDDRFKERICFMKIAFDIESRIEPVPFNSNTFIEGDPLLSSNIALFAYRARAIKRI
ncbi:MAG: nucleotidyltransferase domain-containing protein [Desulfobacterales bacterium]|nr:nucleotidyltransferase domain-containing protein [Desulfobacterales bacterium]